MKHPNELIIDKYFEAYEKHDMNAIREVMSDEVVWTFKGRHPLAGIFKGVNEVVAFFDRMGEIMGKAKMKMDKLITSANENYFIECQHSSAEREDGNNLDHFSCVIWTIKNGKIVEGRHFFADPQAVDRYFTAVTEKPVI